MNRKALKAPLAGQLLASQQTSGICVGAGRAPHETTKIQFIPRFRDKSSRGRTYRLDGAVSAERSASFAFLHAQFVHATSTDPTAAPRLIPLAPHRAWIRSMTGWADGR